MNNFVKYFLNVYRYKYFDFKGRASRKEFWFFQLFLFGIPIVLSIVFDNSHSQSYQNIYRLYFFGSIIPWITIQVRRFHDMNINGWTLLGFPLFIFMVSLLDYTPHDDIATIVIIILIIILLLIIDILPGTKGPNKYGEDPLDKNNQFNEFDNKNNSQHNNFNKDKSDEQGEHWHNDSNKDDKYQFKQESQEKDPYEILGVKKDDSFEYIKKKYKKNIRKYHPDFIQSKGLDEEFIKFATKKTQELNEAFEKIKKSKGE